MTRLHLKVSANTSGRDFVVGDLHGCLDLLEIELARVGFDTAVDRLFSVGDLIDRGPDSMACLRLLHKPWFFAVRGNHEGMLLDYLYEVSQPYSCRQSARLLVSNGGRWIFALDSGAREELREELFPLVNGLPYVITVGEGPARFHVAHAELMTGSIDQHNWLYELAGLPLDLSPPRILTDDELTEETLAGTLEPLLWGRRLWKKLDLNASREVSTPAGTLLVSPNPMHPSLSLTYVGHTPLRSMMLHESHMFIDRGAYKRDALSCLSLLSHAEVRSWLS